MSSHDTKIPPEADKSEWRSDHGYVIESPNPSEHLLGRILALPNVRHAWNRIRANKGAAGIDGMLIEAFSEFAKTDWKRIRQSPLAGTYQPLPVKRVEIPKATGGTRPLGIPTVTSYCTSF
jgi:RNA-directed DNA polymerase